MPQSDGATFFMKEIILTQGKVALVDDEDFEELNKFKWQAVFQDKWYAARHDNSLKSRRLIRMHCLLMGTIGTTKIVDHRNGNGLDNQRHNMRLATPAQNAWNRKKQDRGASKYKGVLLHQKKRPNEHVDRYWVSRITVNKKLINLGYFTFNQDGEIEASIAYNEAAKIHYGEFAVLNQI